jgi:uncharacterized membrane protein
MLEALLDALIDTAKIVPVLLLVYILIAYITHRTKKPFDFIIKKGKYYGPLLGSALGSVPQCGFSAVMADLYSKRAITIGTLFAVFLATSDEALPILIANPVWYKELLILLGTKFLIGVIFGYAIDFVTRLFSKKSQKLETNVDIEIQTHNEEIDEVCEGEHSHVCSCGHHHVEPSASVDTKKSQETCCADNIFLDALIHTAKITLFILIFNIIFTVTIYYVGMDRFISFVSINKFLQPLATALIGLIPNCASSVFLTELYMSGGITLPAAIGGLCTGSGIGIFVLFKQNKNIKENLLILLSLYLIGAVVGIALTPIL